MRVTDFNLEFENQMIPVEHLIKALNEHCKVQLDGESFCCPAIWNEDTKDTRVPGRFRWLVAYAVKGESEGWYIHIGAVIQANESGKPTIYQDFGFAKVWSEEASFAVAKEAQRFLTDAQWN